MFDFFSKKLKTSSRISRRLVYKLLQKTSREYQNASNDVISFYSQFIYPGSLCFDVGANLGNKTDAFLRLGSKVVCIEPQPYCVQTLKQRFAKRTDVVVVDKALGECSGVLTLFATGTASKIATLSKKWQTGRFKDYTWNQQINVTVTTLDNLVHEYDKPFFCKIDVEGYEYQVLKGLSSAIPVISFEFTREFFSDAILCIEHLNNLDRYMFNYAVEEKPQLELSEWVGSSELLKHIHKNQEPLLWGDIYAKLL